VFEIIKFSRVTGLGIRPVTASKAGYRVDIKQIRYEELHPAGIQIRTLNPRTTGFSAGIFEVDLLCLLCDFFGLIAKVVLV
jgi:hypothetical protein